MSTPITTETISVWKEHYSFDGRAQGYSVPMDATPPLGHSYGPTPKETLLLALSSCSGMDVVGLLKKNHQFVDHFEINAKGTLSTQDHPKIYSSVHLTFQLEGAIEKASALSAVEKSQTLYCSVSAMLSKSVPISWTLILNGETVGHGKANFEKFSEAQQSRYEG